MNGSNVNMIAVYCRSRMNAKREKATALFPIIQRVSVLSASLSETDDVIYRITIIRGLCEGRFLNQRRDRDFIIAASADDILWLHLSRRRQSRPRLTVYYTSSLTHFASKPWKETKGISQSKRLREIEA